MQLTSALLATLCFFTTIIASPSEQASNSITTSRFCSTIERVNDALNSIWEVGQVVTLTNLLIQGYSNLHYDFIIPSSQNFNRLSSPSILNSKLQICIAGLVLAFANRFGERKKQKAVSIILPLVSVLAFAGIAGRLAFEGYALPASLQSDTPLLRSEIVTNNVINWGIKGIALLTLHNRLKIMEPKQRPDSQSKST